MMYRAAPFLLIFALAAACSDLPPDLKSISNSKLSNSGIEEADPLAPVLTPHSIVIYRGGSLGVEIPRPLEHHYTERGAIMVSGLLNDPMSSGKTGGVNFIVSPEAEKKVSGRMIDIKVVGSSSGAGQARLAYSTNEVGNSGWLPLDFAAGNGMAAVSYSVPAMVDGLGDFIGVDPNGGSVEIKAIIIDLTE